MASTVAVVPVVRAQVASVGAPPQAGGTPEPPSLLAVGPHPLGGQTVAGGERGGEVADLEQLADQGGGRVEVPGLEERDRAAGQLAADLADRCEADDIVVAEAEWGPALDPIGPEDGAADPERVADPAERLCIDAADPDPGLLVSLLARQLEQRGAGGVGAAELLVDLLQAFLVVHRAEI